MAKPGMRQEEDSLGPVEVPEDALWGAQTQRAVDNFQISGRRMPAPFIRALALTKAACAEANQLLGQLPDGLAGPIVQAAEAIASGDYGEAFPVDVYQTGSGTSTNMNMNEVIARLASTSATPVHPNDHVNRSQSSNDVIPTALHVAVSQQEEEQLVPALRHLIATIARREGEFEHIVKTGRTHLMDAMPITCAQELSGWRTQLELDLERLGETRKRVNRVAIGATAVGSGINAPPAFGDRVAQRLAERTGIAFVCEPNGFAALSSQDTAVEMSGQLRTLATSLTKIANDLRWMNSGPLAGLGEIALPALQPGSSIMPGKVNPVIPEAVIMAAQQVIGLDTAVAAAGAGGNFQLNVGLPLVATNLLDQIGLLARAAEHLADRAIAGFTVNEDTLREALDRNPILVTALNAEIGYEAGARIAKEAYATGRPIIDVAAEHTGIAPERLRKLLDPAALTGPHRESGA